MEYAVCSVAVAPLRKSAGHEQEMTSQLLFGEYVKVLDKSGEWFYVQCRHDDYTGWCQAGQLTAAEAAAYDGPGSLLLANWVNPVPYKGGVIHAPYGSNAAGISGAEHAIWNAAAAAVDETVIRKAALTFLNTPYLWGGRSVFGIDCSGFTQLVYSFLNVRLPRDAKDQALRGTAVDFLQEARCGDLAFFDNGEGNIIHTGPLLSSSEIIHAAGFVRIDHADHAGIVHAATGKRTHQLRLIRRYL